MMLFAMLNQTNTEIIRELLESVLHNFIEDVASCPNHNSFGECLDRKGSFSSESEGFCMAVRCLSFYSFSTFMSCCIPHSSHAGIFKSDYTSWMLQFLESSEKPLSAQMLMSQAAATGEREMQTQKQVQSLFSLELQIRKAGTEFKKLHISVCFSLYASICKKLRWAWEYIYIYIAGVIEYINIHVLHFLQS